MEINTIILAAGMGKRLKTKSSKVIIPLINKPLIMHLLDNISSTISIEDTYIIVGHHAEKVKKVVISKYPKLNFVLQKEQLGTGHAVLQTKSSIKKFDQPTLILAGDVPLVNSEMIKDFISFHINHKADISVLSTSLDNPKGYGRIIRDKDANNLLNIVEEKDATEKQKEISEINSGIYLVNTNLLYSLLEQITPNNSQNEYYLTDIIRLGSQQNKNIQPYLYKNSNLLHGVNNRNDLALIAKYIYQTTIQKHLNNGVTILSPETTFIEPEVSIGKDVIIEPNVHIKGNSLIKENSYIKSFSYITPQNCEEI